MPEWNELKRDFREALISGFTWSRLGMVLEYHTDRRLDRITSQSEGFDKVVDDVIADAVRNGWLEDLAKGALQENERHVGLNNTVPQILDGVAAGGKAYYQQTGGPGAGQQPDIKELHRLLIDLFSLEELATFSSLNLGVELDDLGGSGKPAKARELVLYMQRRGKLDLLSRELQLEIEQRQG